jgi:NADH-quinone oxidoreductase subunit N
MGLVLAGLAAKLGAAPFHQWVVDVLEGAPSCVSVFAITAMTTALFVALVRVLELQPLELTLPTSDVLGVMAALSLLVCAAMAAVQLDVKRILAYTSVSNVGLALVALAVGSPAAHAALLFFLFVYTFANVGAFAVLVALARDGEECAKLEDLHGLAQRRPGLAGVWTLFLLTLVGVPGTGGFMAKFGILAAALEGGFVWLAISAVLASLLSLACYARLLTRMYMGDEDAPEEELRAPDERDAEPTREMRSLDLSILAACAIAVLYLGLLPARGPFEAAAQSLAPRAAAGPVLPAAEDADVALPAGDVELVE